MGKRSCTCIIFGLLLTAVLADRAFSAELDDREPVSLNGTVTKVVWNHPQVHLFMDVKDAADKVTNWEVEFGSRDRLEDQGWTALRIGVGSDVNVRGWKSADSVASAEGDSITTSAGIRLSARPSAGIDRGVPGETGRPTRGQQTGMASSPDTLPETAGALALAGLFGLLSCAAAGAIHASRLTR